MFYNAAMVEHKRATPNEVKAWFERRYKLWQSRQPRRHPRATGWTCGYGGLASGKRTLTPLDPCAGRVIRWEKRREYMTKTLRVNPAEQRIFITQKGIDYLNGNDGTYPKYVQRSWRITKKGRRLLCKLDRDASATAQQENGSSEAGGAEA